MVVTNCDVTRAAVGAVSIAAKDKASLAAAFGLDVVVVVVVLVGLLGLIIDPSDDSA